MNIILHQQWGQQEPEDLKKNNRKNDTKEIKKTQTQNEEDEFARKDREEKSCEEQDPGEHYRYKELLLLELLIALG
jgi:hypothetical protein